MGNPVAKGEVVRHFIQTEARKEYAHSRDEMLAWLRRLTLNFLLRFAHSMMALSGPHS